MQKVTPEQLAKFNELQAKLRQTSTAGQALILRLMEVTKAHIAETEAELKDLWGEVFREHGIAENEREPWSINAVTGELKQLEPEDDDDGFEELMSQVVGGRA